MSSELPPGVQEIDRIGAPGGGYWVLGSDGGVFAVEGADFFGSYWSIDEKHRNDPNRQWSRIEASPSGNGYQIVSTNQETYRFEPQVPQVEPVTPAPTPAPTTTAPEALTGQEADAKAILDQLLGDIGLSELGGQLFDFFQGEGSQSVELTRNWLRGTPQYQARFPAMKLRKDKGLPPIDEQTYLEWERTTKAMMGDYELPKGFYDSESDFTNFIANDISPTELQERIVNGFAAAQSAPQEVRNELANLYGVTPGGLAAFFLDPERATTAISRDFTEAQISGAAVRGGFGSLQESEAERLRELGLSAEAAGERFGQLSLAGQITGRLPGEEEEALTREEQLRFVEGAPSAREQFRRRQRRRTAQFEGGGGFAGGQGGLSGLGEAG